MNVLQSYFDACSRALLTNRPIPPPVNKGFTVSHINQEFNAIRNDMDKRVWVTEVKALAADLTLDPAIFVAGYETLNREPKKVLDIKAG